jgi:hypothetical protein
MKLAVFWDVAPGSLTYVSEQLTASSIRALTMEANYTVQHLTRQPSSTLCKIHIKIAHQKNFTTLCNTNIRRYFVFKITTV